MRRCRCPTLLVLLLALVAPTSCGGGGGSGSPAVTGPVVLEGGRATLTLDPEGRLVEVSLGSLPENLAAADPRPFLELVRNGIESPVEAVRRDGSDLVATFDAGTAEVRLGLEENEGDVTFRVEEAPPDAELLRLRLALDRRDVVEPALNGTYDDEVILCLRSLTANTRCIYRSLPGGTPQPGVEWTREHGIVGGAAAFLATSRGDFFDAVGAVESANGLPSSRFGGVPARLSAEARQSCFFLTSYLDGDLPTLVEAARIGGFGLVLLLEDLWCESVGTCALDPVRWPGGIPEFRAFCDDLRAAGLGVGVHLFGPSVDTDDPLVTPVPHDGLLAFPASPLAAATTAGAIELVLSGTPDLPETGGGGYPGRYLRIGNEIVRYAGTDPGPPFRFIGCQRGALGTVAAAHSAGELPMHLATVNDRFLVDPDGPLVETLAANLGEIVNEAGIDLVYFDGTAVMPQAGPVPRWYYMNRLLPAYDRAFDHPVLVQTAMGIGRELDWHLVARSASADGHGDIRAYLDLRTSSIETILRSLSVPDVGWYGFDSGRPPDYLEYVAAKCLGWGCGLSVQSYRAELRADRRARETLEMLGRYERCKAAGSLPVGAREDLCMPGRDFRLLEDDDGTFHLFRAAIEPAFDVGTLVGESRSFSVANLGATPVPLSIEITRGNAVLVDADWEDPGVRILDALTSATPFEPDPANDSARLVNRIEKVMNAAGPARSGVEHEIEVGQDAAVGGPFLRLVATNGNNTAGWCAIGRDFDPFLDLTDLGAAGIRVRGDGSGVELLLELVDDRDRRAVLRIPVFHTDWRSYSLPLATPAGFDRTRVRYLLVTVTDILPGGTVDLGLASLRGSPEVRPARILTGVEIEVAGRSVELPAPLAAGGSARIDGLGRVTIWPGGMAGGATYPLPDGPILLPPGTSSGSFRVSGPDSYPGDVTLRLSRLEPIDTE